MFPTLAVEKTARMEHPQFCDGLKDGPPAQIFHRRCSEAGNLYLSRINIIADKYNFCTYC